MGWPTEEWEWGRESLLEAKKCSREERRERQFQAHRKYRKAVAQDNRNDGPLSMLGSTIVSLFSLRSTWHCVRKQSAFFIRNDGFAGVKYVRHVKWRFQINLQKMRNKLLNIWFHGSAKNKYGGGWKNPETIGYRQLSQSTLCPTKCREINRKCIESRMTARAYTTTCSVFWLSEET